MNDTTKVVSFRLGQAEHELLVVRGGDLNKSVGEVARDLLISALQTETKSPSSGSAPSGSAREVEALRNELSLCLEAILIATRALNKDEARLFIEQKFPRK